MSDFDNTNRGVLFKNDKRETENHPHAKGSINIEGKEYWLSAWTQTSKAGDRYQSLSAQPKETVESTVNKVAEQVTEDFDDDSIPF